MQMKSFLCHFVFYVYLTHLKRLRIQELKNNFVNLYDLLTGLALWQKTTLTYIVFSY